MLDKQMEEIIGKPSFVIIVKHKLFQKTSLCTEMPESMQLISKKNLTN